MLPGDSFLAACTCARQVDQRQGSAEGAGRAAVITAETLKTVNLAWMPTLAGDVQMVLADGKVRSRTRGRLRGRDRSLCGR